MLGKSKNGCVCKFGPDQYVCSYWPEADKSVLVYLFFDMWWCWKKLLKKLTSEMFTVRCTDVWKDLC